MMSTGLKIGNRRLLKLAEHLEALPRGQYDQTEISSDGARCALGHSWDLPQYRRAARAVPPSGGFFSSSGFYHLTEEEWPDIFGSDGCRQSDGRSARTGKQAARFIRKFVAARGDGGKAK